MTSRSKNITDYRQLGGTLTKTKYAFDDVITEGRLNNVHHWIIQVSVVVKPPNGGKIGKLLDIKDEWFDSSVPLPADHCGYYVVEKWIGDGDTHDVEPTLVLAGKNIGKTNATNVFTQALSEAYSLRLKYIDRNAYGKVFNGIDLYPPMLATKLAVGDLEIDPVAVSAKLSLNETDIYQQRKYDGVRAVMTLSADRNSVIIYSRQLKEYTQFAHLRDDIRQFLYDAEAVAMAKVYLDGELYKHGHELQDISGVARRKNSTQELLLDYNCYDCFVPSKPYLIYSERRDILDQLFDYPENYKWINHVETWTVTTPEQIIENHTQCLADGYEGSMIRLDEPYEYSYKGYHCANLLKIKPKLDAEFTISGYFAAEKGRSRGCLMWKCKTDEGKEFNVTPMGTLEDRKKLYIKLSQNYKDTNQTLFQHTFEGKPMTIKFDGYSKDNVPVRGNAVAVRDYE